MPLAPGRYDGLVCSATGGVYEVEVHQEGSEPPVRVEASLRGRLKREARTGDAVVTGDRVQIESHEDGSHTIEAIANRTSELARKAPGRGRGAKVIVANVDQLLAVFAYSQPAPRLRMLDRFLVLAENNRLDPVIVANKADLKPHDDDPFEPYRTIGYPVLETCAATGEGIDALRETLRGRVSVLAGPSGVGKSSLLNLVQPGLALRTGDVSQALNKGRHTTVSARLIPLDGGGYVADTPGLRELGLWDVDPAEIDLCFPEMLPYLEQCRFGRSCTHLHEPACAVRAAVEEGTISRQRYESYRALMAGDDER